MIKRDTVVLVIAVVCGLAAFVLVLNFLREAAQPKRQFVIASQSLSKGHIIGRRDVKFSEPMKNLASQDLFLQIDDVIGTKVLEDIPQGKLIRRSNVVKREAPLVRSSKAPLPIPTGMKGLTISLKDVDQMPDLLDIGGYADLVGRVPNYEDKIETKTVIRGAQVVSVERSEDLEMKSLTVALSPTEAEAVLDALSRGKIRIVVSTEEGTGPVYQASGGTMEIIRGVNKQPKVVFGKTAESTGGKAE